MEKVFEALEEIGTINLGSNPYRLFEENEIKNIYNKEFNSIKQALLNAQEQEKELVDVEKVKSGKTIIHIGKDLVMMNKAKYYEYLELEEEPVSKRILQAKCEEQEKVLEIIFEKDVDIALLKESENSGEYNMHFPYREIYHLTQEEFDLLKR